MISPPASHRVPPLAATTFGYRADIQGLRAVAVVLVVLWHAGVTAMPHGYVGVDAFFVISGYVITGLLLRERQTTGRIRFGRFFARRARRLLPASGVVIAATVLLAWWLVPSLRHASIARDALASTLYVENWRLAAQAVDYTVQEAAASPFQHYWSLGVEEQFYLTWPLLFALATPRGSFRRGVLTVRLAVLVGAIATASFVWSVIETTQRPGPAYFSTFTRAFEFAAGAGAAVFIHRAHRRSMPIHTAHLVGWTGLALIVTSALWQPAGAVFPGWVAIIPVVGAVLALVGAADHRSAGPAGLLSTRPFTVIGDLSYSWYLWHWPLLVVAEAQWGRLTVLESGAVVVASLGPAALTYRYIESPIRHSPRTARTLSGLSVGGASMAVAAAASAVLWIAAPTLRPLDDSTESALDEIATAATLPTPTDPATATGSESPPTNDPSDEQAPDPSSPPTLPELGALTIDEPGEQSGYRQDKEVDEIVNDPATVLDVPDRVACRQSVEGTELIECVLGDPDGSFEIALVGDSKAAQWVSALDEIGIARGWRVMVVSKAACAFSGLTLARDGVEYTSCTKWNQHALDYLIEERPDLILVTGRTPSVWRNGTALSRDDSQSLLVEDWARRLTTLTDNDSAVAVLSETPTPRLDVPECVVTNRDDLTRCTFDRDGSFDRDLETAAALVGGISVIDLNDAICPGDECPVVVGNVMVYRDTTHLSDTYARTLIPLLASALDRAAGSME